MEAPQQSPSQQASGITGLKKRQLIKSANKTVFLWVVIAAAVIGVCGVFSEFMLRQMMFNNRVISAKATTNDTIKKNISAYDGLKEQITQLLVDTNLTALKKGEGSTPLQVVLDALPVEDNKAAFAASMQLEILAPTQVKLDGFSISSVAAVSNTVTASATTGNVQSVGFTFSITGHYDQVMQAIRNMERSIRPIDIQNVKFEGGSANMRATIAANTFYQPEKSASSLQKEQIKP